MQLSLWEEPIAASGVALELRHSWADGDTSEVQLERLAAILLRPGTNGDSLKADNGDVYLFKIIATRIDLNQGCVWATVVEDVEKERALGILHKRGTSEASEGDDDC